MEQNITKKEFKLPYYVEYRGDGVFLNLQKNFVIGDETLPVPLIIQDLKRRGIVGLRQGDIVLRMRKGETSIRIADNQDKKEADTNVYVTISKDSLSAEMWLLPPTENGALSDAEKILQLLKKEWNITHGIDQEVVERAVAEQRWCEAIPFAQGVAPKNGEDGFIEILFQTQHSFVPEVLVDGSVDYRNLNTFATVNQGDVLAIRIPPKLGQPGVTVQGKEIKAKPGKDVKLPGGKNVSPGQDPDKLIADKSGRVDFINKRVEVSEEFVVEGNVDMRVGNITFPGDVRIHGGVIAGMTITSEGDIEVDQVVEAATLIAGQNIVLKKGIQGMDKAVLKAGCNVVSRFLERCTVEAGGDVHSDYIVHSTVTAMGAVILQGKRGRLIGGVTRAGKAITARVLGTPTGERTVLEVGPMPEVRRRYNDYADLTAQCKAQLDKIDATLRIYQRKQNDEAVQPIYNKLVASREQVQEEFDKYALEMESMKQDIAAMSGGTVNVMQEANHDVKITIDNANYTVREPIPYATFKCRDGEIVYTSYDSKEVR